MKNFLLLFLMFFITSYTFGQYGPTDDFDGDGFLNSEDIDDDNDGIRDNIESICEAYVTGIVSYNNVANRFEILDAPDLDGARFWNGSSEIIVDFGQSISSGTKIYFETRKTGTADKTLYIQKSNFDGSVLSPTIDNITITNNTYNTVPDVEYVLPEDTQYLKLFRNDSYTTYIYVDAIIHPEGGSCTNLSDEDADSIPDKFDLDSDNDGCPDSLEGQGVQVLVSQIYLTKAPTDPYEIGMIKTGVHPAGPNAGLPQIVGAGNSVGTSLNPFEQKDECRYWCSDTTGPDTDGDGRRDKCDTDDDNDGILDINEGLECKRYATFFSGEREYVGQGDINDAKEGGVMTLKNFVREINASGNEVPAGQKYDLKVLLTDIYPNGTSFTQQVDFQWGNSTSSDELVVFYGGPPTDDPNIKMVMTLIDPITGASVGFSDATIRLADIDSNENQNFTDVVGILNDSQLTSSAPILPSNVSRIEAGGFAYRTSDPYIQNINSTYKLYRLEQEAGNPNGPWYSAENEDIPNPSFNVTAGFKFDQLNSLNVVWGYTTAGPNAYSGTTLNRGLAFSRDEFTLCEFTDTDLDGIPNEEDLDSDGDGCPDAIEGAGNYNASNIVIANNIPGGNNYDGSTTGTYNGIVTIPSYETLAYGPNVSNSYGIPYVVDSDFSDDRNDTQLKGTSQNISINKCVCEKTKAFDDQNIEPSLVGVTAIQRNNANNNDVVNNYSDGFLALESKTLGFVPTRIPSPENVFDSNNSTPSTTDNAVEGMVVWDADKNCLRLFDGTVWRCIKKSCDEDVVPPSRP